ncbi:Endonuclease Q, cleaves 5' to damaged DNA bases, partial [hydrothermal vent metagenome]
KTRKIHSLIFAPSIEAVRKINTELARRGNVNSDGRPIFGFTAKELLKIALSASPDAMLIPAHAWTPWFSIFGSKSGFDTIEECFGDMTPHIFAIETGLSSDPQMNRRVSMLDNITLISNSDAHSPAKLGREATIFEAEMDYLEITGAIKKQGPGRLVSTIEFFPEEGKYHSDGHRDCGVLFSPAQTREAGGKCPECGGKITVGVLSRVEDLSDRSEDCAAKDALPCKKLVPLQEIIAVTLGRGVNTKGVQKEYMSMTDSADEFQILLGKTEGELKDITSDEIASAILRVRDGHLEISPGFDGQFGTIGISKVSAQRSLI